MPKPRNSHPVDALATPRGSNAAGARRTPTAQTSPRSTRDWYTPMRNFAEIEEARDEREIESSGSEADIVQPVISKRKSVAFETRRTNLREVKSQERIGRTPPGT